LYYSAIEQVLAGDGIAQSIDDKTNKYLQLKVPPVSLNRLSLGCVV